MSVNKVMLLGNLGDDVKLHHFEGGNCVGNFSLATNESYVKKDTGEKITETEWHKCVARNKTAEVIEKYVNKGDQIFIEGKIKTRMYEQNGEKKYSTEIQVLSFSFVGKSNDSSGGSSTPKALTPPIGEEDDVAF